VLLTTISCFIINHYWYWFLIELIVGSLSGMICGMPEEEDKKIQQKAGRHLPSWEVGELPDVPSVGLKNWTALIGPGIVLAGSNIGGGEWLFGPIVTARYGGQVMWLATLSIFFQVFYNLAVMRYTLYSGEPIMVGFMRTKPGPKFWAPFYLLADLGGIWPYLASNAAVPLAAAFLGRLPDVGDDSLIRNLGYAVFLAAFVPLIFGGKIYNAIERVMLTKIVLVFSYLSFIGIFLVSKETWIDVFTGFFKFGVLPAGEVDWPTLAAFAAIAGAGGLSNMTFSNYTRDKGWGMGRRVGAIPSMIGGRTIALSHVGKIFHINPDTLVKWRGWVRHIVRDQTAIWAVGCILGMALPAILSREFIFGVTVEGHAAAAMTARGLADRSGEIFWLLTLLCGFIVLAPGQVTDIDGITRRWTDVIWTANKRVRRMQGNQVKNIYYGIMFLYCLWGLLALRLTPDPLVLAIVTTTLRNIGLGVSALHALYVNRAMLPSALRPAWYLQAGLVGSFVFFMGISVIAFLQQWSRLTVS
tara:strand:+ start:141455 stop:143035 length:1581 start_codon:yes stop_codon:yes gene_type:complete